MSQHFWPFSDNKINAIPKIIAQVTLTEAGGGKSGRGLVIQDVNASTSICMSRIRDLPMYPKMVPHVKKVGIYESTKFNNVSPKSLNLFSLFGDRSLSFINNKWNTQNILNTIFICREHPRLAQSLILVCLDSNLNIFWSWRMSQDSIR